LIVGIPPFYCSNRKELFENILTGPLIIPRKMSEVARSFILSLLDRNPRKRLGAGPADAQELKDHQIFEGIDWNAVANRTIQMPHITSKSTIPFNSDAKKKFEQDEKTSEKAMNKLYKDLKHKTAPSNTKIQIVESNESDFNIDPSKLNNWTFFKKVDQDELDDAGKTAK